MLVNQIACAGFFECYVAIETSTDLNVLLLYGLLAISVLGFVGNFLSSANFVFKQKCKTRCFRIFRMISVNSLLVNANDLGLTIVTICLNERIFRVAGFDFYLNKTFVQYYIYAYFPIWSVLYTFASVLNMYAIFDRVQALSPTWRFLKNTAVWVVTFWLIIFSLVLNIPTYISRQVLSVPLKIGRDILTLHAYEQSVYFKNNIYVILFYAAQVIRDCLLFLVILMFLVVLVVFINKRQMIEPTMTIARSSNKQTELTRRLQRIEKKENNVVAIIMGILSLLVHLSNFVVAIIFIYNREFFLTVLLASTLVNGLKHTLNPVIFISVSTKFRKG